MNHLGYRAVCASRPLAVFLFLGALLVADGGIRSHTVPLLRRAGADVIVPGSLVFQSQNLVETFSRLRAL